MGKVISLYGGRDPREVPAYTVAESAGYLRVPSSTLAAWVGRKRYAVRGGSKRMPAVIKLSDAKLLTWNNLVEGYVLASLTRTFDVPLAKVRDALEHVGGERPLLNEVFHSDGGRIFIETATGGLEDITSGGQLAIGKVVRARLRRVELDDESRLPMRLYPWWKNPEEVKVISLDARRAFGKPTVVGAGVKVEVIVDRFMAGDGIKRLSKDYELPEDTINDVLRWKFGVPQAA